jgi:Nitrile hydratase, alpha chain
MHDHDHNHDHDHDRTVKPMVEEITDFEVLEIALRELCIEKGIFTAEEHRRFTEFAEQIGPAPAARLVARAWLDPDFKALALAEPLTASKEVGVDWLEPTGFGTPSDFTAFQILADTPAVHTSSSARCVRATRGRSSATRPSGTARPTTAVDWSDIPAKCFPNSACTCPMTSRCAFRTRTRRTASW